MLLLTTTPTRAATFMRTVERLLTQQTYGDADPGGGLVVVAHGRPDPAGGARQT